MFLDRPKSYAIQKFYFICIGKNPGKIHEQLICISIIFQATSECKWNQKTFFELFFDDLWAL